MFVAGPIIDFFVEGDPRFADAVPVLMIVIWGLPLQAAAIIYGRLLITADRERVFVPIGLAAMLVNVILNSILIPRYSYFGASAATIVSMLTSFLMHHAYLTRTHLRPPVLRALFGPAAATVVAWLLTAFGLGALFPGWGLTWRRLPVDAGWTAFLVPCLAMTVAYAAALFGLRVLRREDVRLVADMRRPGGPAA
jgi:O-antigen/teichoic acid export membrane protein